MQKIQDLEIELSKKRTLEEELEKLHQLHNSTIQETDLIKKGYEDQIKSLIASKESLESLKAEMENLIEHKNSSFENFQNVLKHSLEQSAVLGKELAESKLENERLLNQKTLLEKELENVRESQTHSQKSFESSSQEHSLLISSLRDEINNLKSANALVNDLK